MSTIKYHTKEEALTAVIKNGNELRYCTPELQLNEEVMIAAAKQDSWSFDHASDTFKSIDILPSVNEGDSMRLDLLGFSQTE